MRPGDLSGDTGVIATNLALAAGSLVLILVTATLFNQTVQENSEEIHGFFRRLMGPLRSVVDAAGSILGSAAEGRPWMSAVGGPVAMLGLAGVIYGFSEPGFGLNTKSLVLFLSIVLGFAVVMYSYNGSQVLMTRRAFRAPAAIRMIPIGIGIAIVSVILSRLENFQPGIIYGFIATYAVLGAVDLDHRQNGQVVLVPGLALLAVCVSAWLLVSPFRDLAQDNNSWLAAVPEGVAVAVFVGGLEGLFFNMVPLQFMDGYKVWRWNKLAWVAIAGASAFLFWHVLLNTESESFSALQETMPATAAVIVGICLVLTAALWLYFRLRAGGGEGRPQAA